MSRVIGLNRNSLDLLATAIANGEGGSDLAFLAGTHLIFLGLSRGTTTRGLDRFEQDRFISGILVFEMSDCRFVGNRWIQLKGGLFEFQFGPGIANQK